MRILRAADYRRMPWKNGGGVTTEIAVYPENAGLDAFEWRLSMALVAQDGPFSLFPGVDRVLAVLEGEGLALSIEAAPPIVVTPASPPLAFAADVPVYGALAGGPVTDLNLMSRRPSRPSMRRVDLQKWARLNLHSRWSLLFNPTGRVEAELDGIRASLGPLDTLVVEGDVHIQFTAGSPGWAFLMEIA